MSEITIPGLNPVRKASLAARLGDMARKAADLSLVALAWGGSWGLVGLAIYGVVWAF